MRKTPHNPAERVVESKIQHNSAGISPFRLAAFPCDPSGNPQKYSISKACNAGRHSSGVLRAGVGPELAAQECHVRCADKLLIKALASSRGGFSESPVQT